MECLFCRMETENSFTLNTQSGNTENTIKEDISEFLGSQVDPYLKPEDCICSICIVMLNDIVKIKRKILEIMFNPTDNHYPIKLGKYWKFLAKTIRVHIDDIEYYEPITPSSLTPSLTVRSGTSSPSERWSVNHNREYDMHKSQDKLFKRKRSQSKSSIRSINDEEVAKLFSPSKSGQKRPKSAGGTSKVKEKLLRRVQSENDRRKSSLSALNTPTLRFGEDKELLRPKTRAVSRVLQKSLLCKECLKEQKDMELYALHMMDNHNRNACYNCIDCGCSFMTEEHLKMHQNIHNDTVLCTICGTKQESVPILQKHTDMHIQYSVPCSYCSLAFLSTYERNMHIFSHHKSKKHKAKSQKQYRIKEQINYINSENNDRQEPWDNNFSTKQYEPLIMILNVKERTEFYGKTYEELEYRMRNPEPVKLDRRMTSLGDDLILSIDDGDSEPPPSELSITESEIQRQTDKDRELDLAELDKYGVENSEEHSIQDLQQHSLSNDQERLESLQDVSLHKSYTIDDET